MKAAVGLCGCAVVVLAATAVQSRVVETVLLPSGGGSSSHISAGALCRATLPVSTPAAEALAPGAPSSVATRRSAPIAKAARRSVGAEVYAAMARRIAQRYSVEWKLVMAIIASESGGDPAAVSPAGAVGLMQLMPGTASDLGVDPFDPEQNVDGAVRYLSSLLSTFGSVDLSLVAYNAGPGFAKRYQGGAVELGAETRAFLIRVGTFLN
jgi:soluble lytic murein transglycosylase-like protein